MPRGLGRSLRPLKYHLRLCSKRRHGLYLMRRLAQLKGDSTWHHYMIVIMMRVALLTFLVCVLSTRSQGVKLSREPRGLFFGRDGIEFGLMHFFMRGGFVVFYHRAVMRRMGWRFFWHFL